MIQREIYVFQLYVSFLLNVLVSTNERKTANFSKISFFFDCLLHLDRISSFSMIRIMIQYLLRIYRFEVEVLAMRPEQKVDLVFRFFSKLNIEIYSYPMSTFFFFFFLWIKFSSGTETFFTVRFCFRFSFDNFESFHLLVKTKTNFCFVFFSPTTNLFDIFSCFLQLLFVFDFLSR